MNTDLGINSNSRSDSPISNRKMCISLSELTISRLLKYILLKAKCALKGLVVAVAIN